MRVIKLSDPEAFQKAKECILSAKVLIYPTDTVYGIGGNALRKEVVDRINSIKKRSKKPFSIILGNIEMIKDYCEVSYEQEKILQKYLPGPYTFILKAKKSLPVTQTKKIGVRIPEHDFTVKLSLSLGIPIVTTSANISGHPDPFQFSDIPHSVLDPADLIVDGGPARYMKSSTVVDLVDNKILRKGAGEFQF